MALFLRLLCNMRLLAKEHNLPNLLQVIPRYYHGGRSKIIERYVFTRGQS